MITVPLHDNTERQVARTCNRCYGNGVSVLELPTIDIVSRYGTAHKHGEGEHTDCGIDASGPGWWWAPDQTTGVF